MKIKKTYFKEHPYTVARRIVQILFFIFINYGLLELIFSINLETFAGLVRVLPILNSPRNPVSDGAGILEYVFYIIAEGKFPVFLIGVLVLIVLFTNRFFCGWICPIGTIQDGCAAIPTKNKKTVGRNTHGTMLKVKKLMIFLNIIIIIPLGYLRTVNMDFYEEYKENLGDTAKKPLGYFSLSEFIFVFFPNLIKESWEAANVEAFFSDFWIFFRIAFYLILIVVSVWYPRVYCKYFCPLGAVNSFLGDYSFIKLRRSPVRCVGRAGCGICEKKCPKQIRILDFDFEFFTGNGECNFCMKCIESCPYDALSITF